MPAPNTLEAILKAVNISEITIDKEGRVIITNPQVAAAVRTLQSLPLEKNLNTECINDTCSDGNNLRCRNSGCQ